MIYGTSVRHKINTKSSTEGELVGVNDEMPQILWTQYFMEAQGYNIKDTVVYQDNHSAILLETNVARHAQRHANKNSNHTDDTTKTNPDDHDGVSSVQITFHCFLLRWLLP